MSATPARSKFRLAKVHIWARDGPVCTFKHADGDESSWVYEEAYMGKSCDGVVIYEVWPLSDKVGGPTHVMQHFGRNPEPDRGQGYPIVWKWDGNEAAPTLSPSFLYFGSAGTWPRIHLFLTAGQVNNLGDSEADLVA